MSHTPGPWKWNKMGRVWTLMPEALMRDGVHITGAVCEIIPLETDGDSQALYTGTEEQHANAALLEAAPDMLAMLEELRECAYCWCDYEVPLGIVERLDEVIRKARDTE